MYLLICLLLSFFALKELSSSKNKNVIFLFLLSMLFLLLSFRYGQGTDYYEYYKQYVVVEESKSIFVNTLDHGEQFWYMLMFAINKIGLNFDIFIVILSTIMFYSLFRSIYAYSPYKVLSLVIFYPTYYLTYCFSAIRQGLVMSLFLGFGLDLLIERKYIKFFVLVFILFNLHNSSIVLALLPISLLLEDKYLEILSILSFLFSLIIGFSGLLSFLGSMLGLSAVYFSNSISIPAICLRLLLIFIIIIFHKNNIKNKVNNSVEDKLYKMYLFGFIVFIGLSYSATLSQRLSMPFKSIEILLIPILINNCYKVKNSIDFSIFNNMGLKKIKTINIVLVLLLVLNVETIKNVYSYIEQTKYKSGVNPVNYPYVSILNKDDIKKYVYNLNGEIDLWFLK